MMKILMITNISRMEVVMNCFILTSREFMKLIDRLLPICDQIDTLFRTQFN